MGIMGVYEQAWKGSAELKSLASEADIARWEAAPKQLLTQPDLAKKILGIMLRLTITPEVIRSRAHNYLEDAGVIKEISEPFGEYKQHILTALPQAADAQFMDIWNKTSVDQQKIWKYEDKEYFQELVNLAIQIPTTISDTEFRQAFTTPGAMESVLSAKREGVVTAFRLNTLYHELDAINKAINDETFPKQANQTVELKTAIPDYDNIPDAAFKEVMKLVRALKFSMTHNFTGEYNQARFPSMAEPDDLIMLIRPQFVNDIGVDLLATTFNRDEYGYDITTVPVPNFGGLTGFTAEYNNEGQQTKSPTTVVDQNDPNADVVAIITTKRYFVKNTVTPFVVESAPYNARGRYVSMYGNYLGGIQAIGYEPFIVIKRAQ